MGGKIHVLRAQDKGRYLKWVEKLLCYRCEKELNVGETIFVATSRGNRGINSVYFTKHRRGAPKVYHIDCAKSVNRI